LRRQRLRALRLKALKFMALKLIALRLRALRLRAQTLRARRADGSGRGLRRLELRWDFGFTLRELRPFRRKVQFQEIRGVEL
jgi:hypothetical protein